jgi:phenylacetic acid degradation operon negative regulatory protein
MQKQKWDKKWRILIFDIAEVSRKTRDILRLKLKELGFGMLQKSVWITPHDILFDLKEFLEEKELTDYIFLMEVSNLLLGNKRDIANKIWRLEKINEGYKALYKEIYKFKNMYIIYNDRENKCQGENTENELKINIVKNNLGKIEKEKRNLRQRYLTLLLSDPGLPRELLPLDWYGGKIKHALRTLDCRK